MAQTLRSLVAKIAIFAALVGYSGAARASLILVEPDLFPIGTVLNNAFPGVTLSNQGGLAPTIISKDGSDPFVGSNIATTGTLVFGRIQDDNIPVAGGSKLWDEGTTFGSLRADFDQLADSVVIDLICTDDDRAFVRGFDASGNQLAEDSGVCDGLGRGGLPVFLTVTINPTDGIAYILAGAFTGDGVYLDNLRVNIVPEPTTLALFVIGLAGLGFMMRREKLSRYPSFPTMSSALRCVYRNSIR